MFLKGLKPLNFRASVTLFFWFAMLSTAVSLFLRRNRFVRMPAVSRLQRCRPLQESYHCLWLYGARREIQ